MNYLLSIITPSPNRAQFISEAVGSVQQQDHPHVEHIIMDGGSTDGTLDLLGNFPSLRVYSQPDQGIYDALNKGIDLAHGEVIGFLNTDDLYEPYILGAIAKIFIDNPQIDALVGGASIFRSTSSGDQSNLAMFPCVPMNQLLERYTLGAPVFNAWFFRKRLLKQLNGFDTRNANVPWT